MIIAKEEELKLLAKKQLKLLFKELESYIGKYVHFII